MAALSFWFVIRAQQATNSDVLWLCEALRRVFSGFNLTEAAFENNPPLSMLIYTLPVLAQSILHLPLHIGVFAQTLGLTAFATMAVFKTLTRWQVFEKYFITILTTAFVLINTICASIFLGERDHYIALGLVPFVLMQLSLTYGLPHDKRWKWAVFILGTLMILLKPHHGLIPSLLIARRIVMRRDLSFFKDADFQALAAGCLIYAGGALYLFPDYFSAILPDVITLYLPIGEWHRVAFTIIGTLVACYILLMGLMAMPIDKNEKTMAYFLLFCGAVSLVPVYVQGLGLYYHYIPAMAFFGMAFGAALYSWLKTAAPQRAPAVISVVILISIAVMHSPFNVDYPTYKNYKDLPLSKVLAEQCPADRQCSFFMINYDMGMMHETAYYNNAIYASRFGSFWFMPILTKNPPLLSDDETDRIYKKYSVMMAEDLIRNRPDVLIIWKADTAIWGKSFIKYFSRNRDYARAIRNYRKVETITTSYDEYYKGTGSSKTPMSYEIYKRISQ